MPPGGYRRGVALVDVNGGRLWYDEAGNGDAVLLLHGGLGDSGLWEPVVPLLDAWSLPAQEVHAVFPSPRMLPLKVSGLVAWLQARFEGEWWARLDDAAQSADLSKS